MEKKLIAEYRSNDGKFQWELFETEHLFLVNQTGTMRLEDAKHVRAAYYDLVRRLDKRLLLSMPLQGFESVDAEARKHMGDALLNNNSPFKKVAVFGGSFLMRIMFNLYARISQKVPLRLFAKQEEAEDWLRK